MLQIYTGNGKGKTTAAIGLAIRAIGAGKKVYIMQFMKGLQRAERVTGIFPAALAGDDGQAFFCGTGRDADAGRTGSVGR